MYRTALLKRVAQGLRSAVSDPLAAKRHAAVASRDLTELQRWIEMRGRQARYQLDVVPDMFVNVDNIPTVAASSTSAQQTLRWPEAGVVVGVAGGAVEGLTAALDVLVRIQKEGSRDLVSNGDGSTFIPYQTLFAQAAGFGWAPLGIRVERRETWQIFFKNANTGSGRTPYLTFGLKIDAGDDGDANEG